MTAALSGMTGFARVTGEAAWGRWAWEAKSVNGRSLDIRVNTPPGLDTLEKAVKASAAEQFRRGNLQVGLRIELADESGAISVNETMLAQLSEAYRLHAGAAPAGDALAMLMTIKGVVETHGSELRDLAGDKAAMSVLAETGASAMTELAVSRREEGASLHALLSGLLGEMAAETERATSLADQQPKLLKTRMERQLAELEAEKTIDAERLAVEIALSASKADIREELDRLRAHIQTGHELIDTGSPAGRKLDFLAQELGREANTLCSKSISLDLTNAGLALKGLIDQFKEQAANVE